jgi:hypothetical protein
MSVNREGARAVALALIKSNLPYPYFNGYVTDLLPTDPNGLARFVRSYGLPLTHTGINPATEAEADELANQYLDEKWREVRHSLTRLSNNNQAGACLAFVARWDVKAFLRTSIREALAPYLSGAADPLPINPTDGQVPLLASVWVRYINLAGTPTTLFRGAEVLKFFGRTPASLATAYAEATDGDTYT